MSSIPNYRILEALHESDNSTVCRGLRLSDERPVILKVLKGAFPPPERIAWFRREFELTRSLNETIDDVPAVAGVVRAHALMTHGGSWVLVFEDSGSESLARLGLAGNVTIPQFIELAISIAKVLGGIHRRDIIHKDVNPTNIVMNPESGAVEFIDFGISARLSRESAPLCSPQRLEGTLDYISPEQTGRMNRAVDYRTDFYSLGVTFFELLTGQLPFSSTDPLELVHQHMAKAPTPPSELVRAVPSALSDIVLKLMSKEPEHRYRSAQGLIADLEACRGSDVSSFELGRSDASDQLLPPRGLYGRAQESQVLLDAFERAAKGSSELVFVRGRGGIGKSALVQGLHHPITRRRGLFISGKYDQLQRDVPYSALLQALGSMFSQILTEGSEPVARWQERLETAMAPNLGVLCDVLPELQLVVGDQPRVPELPPAENRNRLEQVFRRLFAVIARVDQPLVLFLDDMQWADTASLNLFEQLLTTDVGDHMLLLWAYRDHEVDRAHPLTKVIEHVGRVGIEPEVIELGPLPLEDVSRWVSDVLALATDEARPLAEVVLAKTSGNPFFIGRFIAMLHSESLLRFVPETKRWCWDLSTIQARDITDNVVDLLIRTVVDLPTDTQALLQVAACIGSRFDLRTLALASGHDPRTTATMLWAALEDEMVVPLATAYKIVEQDVAGLGDRVNPEYRFAHDHVQNAVLSRLEDSDEEKLRPRIGRLLLEGSTPEQRRYRLFDIVDHLNAGRRLFTAGERQEVAQLNLEAGRKARASAASHPALRYFETGRTLLGDDGWSESFELTMELHVSGAEAAYLCAEFDTAERLTAAVLERARGPLDEVVALEVDIQSRLAQGRLLEAVDIGLDALARLDVALPARTELTDEDIGAAMGALSEALASRPVDTLLDLPEMSDPVKIAAMRLVATITSIAYIAVNQMFPITVAKQVELSLRYGHTNRSIGSYAIYALLLCAFGDIDSGYRFSRLALELWRRRDAHELECEVKLLTAFVGHHKEPLREFLPMLRRAYEAGVETGDIEMAANSAASYCQVLFLTGAELGEVEEQLAVYGRRIAELGQMTTLYWHQIYWQGVSCLQGQTDDPCRLIGDVYDEDENRAIHEESNDQTALLHLHTHKLMLCYRFGRFSEALEHADELEGYVANASAMPVAPPVFFYDALARIAMLGEAEERDRVTQRAKIDASQAKLRLLAQHAPANYLHKLKLVDAELARVDGHHDRAHLLYDQAIELAREQDCLADESLAYETAALFYLAQGQSRLASYHLRDAHYTYLRWGAIAKVRDLEEQHIFLATGAASGRSTSRATVTSTRGTQELDLTSALKASQTISSEIVLESLLERTMKVVLEAAGAERGILVLHHDDRWTIEAEATTRDDDLEIVALRSIPISEDSLPMGIFHYVVRTRRAVTLADAANEGMFVHDPYVLRARPRSVSCIPLVRQDTMTGVLYLENTLTTHAFTEDRQQLLSLLSTQAAISIENSRLYDSQVQLTNAYSRFVPPEYLRFLDKKDIVEVQLGDHVSKEMAVLFSDIRSFTTLSESMTPHENFSFVNTYLQRVSPAIREHGGIIVKYLGDGMMAVFPDGVDDAMAAGLEKLARIGEYNEERARDGLPAIEVGIGIHSGHMMVGVVGEPERMQGDAFSDNVNLAARLESLTKHFGSRLIVSDAALGAMRYPQRYEFRQLGKIQVKGKRRLTAVAECLNGIRDEAHALKRKTRRCFETGVEHFDAGRLQEACACFDDVLAQDPDDRAARLYRERLEPRAETDGTGTTPAFLTIL